MVFFSFSIFTNRIVPSYFPILKKAPVVDAFS